MTGTQVGLHHWDPDAKEDWPPTGIEIACMAHAATGIDPPEWGESESWRDEIRLSIFRTTEFTIRLVTGREWQPEPLDVSLHSVYADESVGQQATLDSLVATDGGESA